MLRSGAVMRVVSRRVALSVAVVVLSVAVVLFMRHAMLPGPAVGAHVTITVIAKEFKLTPNVIRVKAGQPVTIIFQDEGALSHNLTIFPNSEGRPGPLWHTPTIQAGAQATLRFTAPEKAGIYPGWCTVPGHKQAGMILNLVVERR